MSVKMEGAFMFSSSRTKKLALINMFFLPYGSVWYILESSPRMFIDVHAGNPHSLIAKHLAGNQQNAAGRAIFRKDNCILLCF
jgi:hypothetical protein